MSTRYCPKGRPRARIVAADDDPAIRTLLRLNLEAEGHDVEIVEDGLAAHHAVLRETPDLVVLDIMMPGRDGYDVLRALKDHEATAHIPVVLLTAKATDAEVWDGWKAGADYYITKPFNVDELVHFVDYLLAQQGEQSTETGAATFGEVA